MSEPIARSEPHVSETASQEAAPVPEVQIQKLGPRVRGTQVDDPFEMRMWQNTANQETQRRSRRADRPTPRPPPLPYAYLGKLIQGEETFLVLARQDRNYIVRAGEKLEDLYRIRAIEADRLVVDYLPLRIQQTLMFESVSGPTSDSTRGSAHRPPEVALSDEAAEQSSSSDRIDARDPVALLVAVPRQAPIGGEFSVRLGVPAGNDTALARVVLAYDPKLLRPANAAVARSGRLSLDLRGPGVVGAAAPSPTDIRFRVVATKPATTRLRLENPSAADINGNALPLTTRRIHTLAVVPAGQPH